MYTMIIHPLRKALNLNLTEYCVLESIRALSHNNKFGGWCIASKQNIADGLDITRAQVHNIINKLIDREFIEKGGRGALRTVDDYNRLFDIDGIRMADYEGLLSIIPEKFTHSKKTLQSKNVKKFDNDSKKTLQSNVKKLYNDSKKTLHNNNKIPISDTNKIPKKEKFDLLNIHQRIPDYIYEEYTDEQVKQRNILIAEELLNSTTWMNTVGRLANLQPELINKKVKEFLLKIEAGRECFNTLSDIKRHFSNWIKTNKTLVT